MRTKVRPSMWARCRKSEEHTMGAGLRHAMQIEPGIDFLAPARKLRTLAASERRQRRRCRRQSGFIGRIGLTCGTGGGATTGFTAAGASACSAAFATRGFFRNGLVCLATLSHSARSSSLSARLRRGGSTSSGMTRERFIGRRDNDGRAGDDAPSRLGFTAGRASGNGTVLVASVGVLDACAAA